MYGSKDFQFANDSEGDIQLVINVLQENGIVLTLLSSHKIEEKMLHFDRHEEDSKRIVRTFAERHGKREQVAAAVYKIKQ